MNTIIEEIRKRIKAASDNTDEAGDYDEYATGQGVGLATALRIIDEVEKEHPVPADVHDDKAATDYYLNLPNSSYGEGGNLLPRSISDAFKAGIACERERLMSGSLCGNVDMCGVSAWVKLPSKVLTDYLRSNFKEGDEVRVIIIKKEE